MNTSEMTNWARVFGGYTFPDPLPEPEPEGRAGGLADQAPMEGLISAALLTATAFRLKDAAGLVLALRDLVAAVKPYEGDED